MNVLIIGANGFLGNVMQTTFAEGHEVLGTYTGEKQQGLRKLDLRRKGEIASVLGKFKPNLVIHTAGITNVDLCQTDQKLAYDVNIGGMENLLEAYKGKVVYISTDFVFDGMKGNYREEDKPNPLSYYGYTKLESEKVVARSGNQHLICRVAVLYGKDPSNKKFVSWTIDQLRKGKSVNAVTDHFRTPTLIDDVAAAVKGLAEQGRQGIFHVTGPERLSAHQMALKVCEQFSFDKSLVKPVQAISLGQIALRPKDSSLNIDKLRKCGITMKNFSEGLSAL